MVAANDLNYRQTALDGRGGGLNTPPYLQARVPSPGSQFATRSVMRPTGQPKGMNIFDKARTLATAGKGSITPKKPITNAQTGVGMAPTQKPGVNPASATPNTPQTLYDFFKQDLENQRKTAMAGAQSDAASRGVYYGTPLTTSQGDIQTEYLRGLGQLQSGILQNEQQNQLQRLGLASGLLSNTPMPQGGGGIDPEVFQMLGTLFGGSPAVGGQRSGPISPAPQPGQRTGDRITPQPKPPV